MSITAIISDIGGTNARRIKANGIDRSWALGSKGTLSAEFLTSDLLRYGLSRPKSKWIWVYDNDAGTWGGVITDSRARLDGTTEIVAVEWGGGLLDGRSLPKETQPLYGPAGTVALVAITKVERDSHIYLADRVADELGDPVQLTCDGQELLGALDGIASESGQEWTVDPDTMQFMWRMRTGLDKTGSVQLVAPRHIVDFTPDDSLAPVFTELRAFISNSQDTRSQSFTVVNAEAREKFGLRQSSVTFEHGTSAAALRPQAQTIVDRLAKQGMSLELRLVNKDRCFSWFRTGDTIGVLIPQLSSRFDLRVSARGITNGDQVMTISGPLTDWTVYG